MIRIWIGEAELADASEAERARIGQQALTILAKKRSAAIGGETDDGKE